MRIAACRTQRSSHPEIGGKDCSPWGHAKARLSAPRKRILSDGSGNPSAGANRVRIRCQ